jgi:hypothetical protein
MTLGRLAVIALAAVLALGGIGTAFAQLGGDDDPGGVAEPIELRKDDAGMALVQDVDDDDDGDGDATFGDDGTGGGNNTGDGDRTRGNDGTGGGNNTGDGDRTWGNDGTGGGDNTFAPVGATGGGGTDDGGGGGGGGTGGGDT